MLDIKDNGRIVMNDGGRVSDKAIELMHKIMPSKEGADVVVDYLTNGEIQILIAALMSSYVRRFPDEDMSEEEHQGLKDAVNWI